MPFLNPEEIIKMVNIDEGMKVADFGCGPGFYSLAAARAAGKTGKIYAFDILKEKLEILRSHARDQNLMNIHTVRADLEKEHGSHLKDEIADRVIIANILFQAEDKKGVVKEARRILKPRGLVLAIEQRRLSQAAGPSLAGSLLSEEKVKALFEPEGFNTEKEFDAGEQHFGLIFRKI